MRVTDKGRISFIVEGRIRRGGTVRLTLGKHPTLTVPEARALARDQLALMDQGIDPRQHREEQQQEAQRLATHNEMMGVTLSTMLERYLQARTLNPNYS